MIVRNYTRRGAIVAGAAALAAAFAGGCGRKEGARVLKMAHSLDVTHPVHKAMLFMGERLVEKSGGAIRLIVFPSEQLGSERDVVEQVQIGCIDLTKISAASLESFIPEMGVYSIPYIFRDNAHYQSVVEGPVGGRIRLAGERVGFRGLCYYDSGSRSFYTKDHPILTPDDLAGMKIRVMPSKTSIDMIRALGASATPIAWGELYTSLQQGVVDGAENNPPSFYTSRHYEVCKHYSLDEHTMVPDVVIISKVVWDELSENERIIVQEAADDSAAHERTLWDDMTRTSLAEVEKAGVTIYHPDKAPFVEKVRGMHRSYEGTVIGGFLREIQETI
jgi:tripartite ATP-independent transporter DctP family solute receptor